MSDRQRGTIVGIDGAFHIAKVVGEHYQREHGALVAGHGVRVRFDFDEQIVSLVTPSGSIVAAYHYTIDDDDEGDEGDGIVFEPIGAEPARGLTH